MRGKRSIIQKNIHKEFEMIQNQFVVSSQGYPLKVYHGTTISFQYFRPLSHFGTKKPLRIF